MGKCPSCCRQIFSGFNAQKSLKSVNFWQSYLKNKKVDVFSRTQCMYVCPQLFAAANRRSTTPGVAYLKIAYSQTVAIRNIFLSALCGCHYICISIIIYLPLRRNISDIGVCLFCTKIVLFYDYHDSNRWCAEKALVVQGRSSTNSHDATLSPSLLSPLLSSPLASPPFSLPSLASPLTGVWGITLEKFLELKMLVGEL